MTASSRTRKSRSGFKLSVFGLFGGGKAMGEEGGEDGGVKEGGGAVSEGTEEMREKGLGVREEGREEPDTQHKLLEE